MASGADHNSSASEPVEKDGRFLTRFFGPGMLWALLGIGGSHLVLAPSLGATFGYFSLWIAVLVYAMKYGGWELGIRYAHGTGNHPVEGYQSLPGPNNWGLWLTLFIYLVGWPTILAAVGSATASFMSNLEFVVQSNQTVLFVSLMLIALVLILLLSSSYRYVEAALLLFIIPLAGLVVLGVLFSPPSPNLFLTTLSTPDSLWTPTFLSLFAAFAGYAPTGLSTTATIGSWTTAKQRELASRTSNDGSSTVDPMSAFRSGRLDFQIGYLFSFLLIVCMISLSATVLYPNPPSDQNLAITIGRLLVPSFGPWTEVLMMVGGFAALYSTVLTMLDGGARVCSDVLQLLYPSLRSQSWTTRCAILLYMTGASSVPVLIVGSLPVTLVLWSAALMAVLQIFFFAANYYIVRSELPSRMQPGTMLRIFYVVSMILVILFGCMGAFEKLGGFSG